MAVTNAKPEKKVKVFYPLLDGKNVSQEIFVAVNFKSYRIKRGVEVEVPECVKKALDEADRAANEEIRQKQARAFRDPAKQ